MTHDQIEFLRDRLNEEELAARDASVGGGEWTDRLVPGTVFNRGRDTLVDDFPDQAPHIARWDPDRVLAEVEAKRRILGRYEDALTRQTDPDYSSYDADVQAAEYEDWILPQLLAPYANHPDYRAEWRP